MQNKICQFSLAYLILIANTKSLEWGAVYYCWPCYWTDLTKRGRGYWTFISYFSNITLCLSLSLLFCVSLFIGVYARSAMGTLGCWQPCLCSVFDQACETRRFSRSLCLSVDMNRHILTNYSSASVSEASAIYIFIYRILYAPKSPK